MSVSVSLHRCQGTAYHEAGRLLFSPMWATRFCCWRRWELDEFVRSRFNGTNLVHFLRYTRNHAPSSARQSAIAVLVVQKVTLSVQTIGNQVVFY